LSATSGGFGLFLLPGQAITFFFNLPNGADPTFRGKAGALDTFGFSGDTLGCPPPPVLPPGGGGGVTPGIPVRQHGPFYLAEAYPATVQSYAGGTSLGTSGISPDNCFLNGSTQAPLAAPDAVPGILCLSKDVTRETNNPFAICDPSRGEINPVAQI